MIRKNVAHKSDLHRAPHNQGMTVCQLKLFRKRICLMSPLRSRRGASTPRCWPSGSVAAQQEAGLSNEEKTKRQRRSARGVEKDLTTQEERGRERWENLSKHARAMPYSATKNRKQHFLEPIPGGYTARHDLDTTPTQLPQEKLGGGCATRKRQAGYP